MRKTFLPYLFTLIAVFGMASSSIGVIQNAVGVFFLPVHQDLGFGIGAFAFHATLSNVMTGLFSPISLRALRRYDFIKMMRWGILVASGSTFMMAYATHLWQFYLLAILRGMGSSFFALAPIMYIIGNWFKAKQGLAMGLAMSFSGVVGAILNPLMAQLIQTADWSSAYRIMGVLVFVTAFTGTLWLKPHPEILGLHAYGDEGVKSKIDPAMDQTLPSLGLFFGILAMYAFFSSSLSGLVQHFPTYTLTLGLQSALGSYMVSAAMIGNVVFKLVIGELSDRLGIVKSLMLMFSSALVSILTLMGFTSSCSNWLLILSAFLMGSVYAVVAVGTPLLTKHFYPGPSSALVYANLSALVSIGSASAIFVFGAIYDRFGSYAWVLRILLSCLFLVILLLMWMIRHVPQKNKAQ